MAFVRLALFPGGTQEQYARLAAVLADAPVPPERLLFAAGPVADGWQVVQVWTDRRHLEAFNEQSLRPAMAALGGSPFPRPPVVTDLTAVDLSLRPPGPSPR